MRSRWRTVAGVASALVVLALCGLWLAGREGGPSVAANFHRQSRIYPRTWPPPARGVVWLVAGAAAVSFDVLIVRSGAETERGRDLAAAFAFVTGIAFLALALVSFFNLSW